mmetsp:Transcript_19367/g.73194  ORF Transcript_19367/g.73194 Transcript_19367/m.73194 type:complete len:585 (-) Transcript_19367:1792-3546(-)
MQAYGPFRLHVDQGRDLRRRLVVVVVNVLRVFHLLILGLLLLLLFGALLQQGLFFFPCWHLVDELHQFLLLRDHGNADGPVDHPRLVLDGHMGAVSTAARGRHVAELPRIGTVIVRELIEEGEGVNGDLLLGIDGLLVLPGIVLAETEVAKLSAPCRHELVLGLGQVLAPSDDDAPQLAVLLQLPSSIHRFLVGRAAPHGEAHVLQQGTHGEHGRVVGLLRLSLLRAERRERFAEPDHDRVVKGIVPRTLQVLNLLLQGADRGVDFPKAATRVPHLLFDLLFRVVDGVHLPHVLLGDRKGCQEMGLPGVLELLLILHVPSGGGRRFSPQREDLGRSLINLLGGVEELIRLLLRVVHVLQGVLDQRHLGRGFALRRRAFEHVANGLVALHAVDVLLLQPQEGPLRHEGLQDVMVVLRIQEDDVWQLLQALGLHSLRDRIFELPKHRQRCAALLEGGDATLLGEEERIQQVGRETPPFAGLGTVEVELLADGEVQLGFQRVKDHVHLVEKHHALAEELEDSGELGGLLGVLDHLAADTELGGLVDALQALDVAEHDALQRGGRGHDDASVPSRVLEGSAHLRANLR